MSSPRSLEIARYDPVVPPEALTGGVHRSDVVIVGAGLAGLTLALDLRLRGIAALLLDDDVTVGVRGLATRGVVYARRTLEILRRLGVYPRLAAEGITWRVGRVLRDEQIIASFEHPEPTDGALPPFLNIPQFRVEAALADALRALDLDAIRWGNAVTSISMADGRVRLDVGTDAGTYTVDARFVVACDGSHSTLRKALTSCSPPDHVGDWWVILDFWMHGDWPLERWVWIENAQNNGRGVWFHPLGDGLWRLDCQIGSEAEARAMTEPRRAADLIRRILEPVAADCSLDCEPAWLGPWVYRTFVLDRFRYGSTFFAGDAAHLVPPFGARGGNSGIQDVDNLGWKLAAVLDSGGSDALLDSYDTERRWAAIENVEVTGRSARYLVPRGAAARALRDVSLAVATLDPPTAAFVNAGRLSVPNAYPQGAIADDAAPGLPPSVAPGRYAPDVAVGRADRRTSLFSSSGHGWTLFVCPGEEGVAPWLALQDGTGLVVVAFRPSTHPSPSPADCIVDIDGDVQRVYGLTRGVAYLVRPDRCIAWRSAGADPQEAHAVRCRILQQGASS